MSLGICSAASLLTELRAGRRLHTPDTLQAEQLSCIARGCNQTARRQGAGLSISRARDTDIQSSYKLTESDIKHRGAEGLILLNDAKYNYRVIM